MKIVSSQDKIPVLLKQESEFSKSKNFFFGFLIGLCFSVFGLVYERNFKLKPHKKRGIHLGCFVSLLFLLLFVTASIKFRHYQRNAERKLAQTEKTSLGMYFLNQIKGFFGVGPKRPEEKLTAKKKTKTKI